MPSKKMSESGKAIEPASPAPRQAEKPQMKKIRVVDFSVGDAENNSPRQDYDQMPDYYRSDDDQDHILEWDPVAARFLPQSVLRAREELKQARAQQAKVTTHSDKDTGAEGAESSSDANWSEMIV